jgi:XTP/dITP diphosphohydrolase
LLKTESKFSRKFKKILWKRRAETHIKKGLEIIIATRNKGKILEIRKALKGLDLRIRTLSDFSDIPDVAEDGCSFAENALKKARFYSKYFRETVLADDSGLEVDSLKGAPGIYSARYAGEKATGRENNQKLLREMQGIPASKRGATFQCVIAIVSPDGREAVAEGSCRGRIGFKEKGRRGFGYDPLFILLHRGKTMAELPLLEKNKISHRGKALRRIKKMIKSFMGNPSILGVLGSGYSPLLASGRSRGRNLE